MTPRQWLALFFFYTIYLFFGASIFYNIEHGYEVERRAEELEHRIEINELLVHYTSPNDVDVQNHVLERVSTYCGKPVTNYTLDKYVDPYLWDFYHSVFFAFTVCSTLGYGNIAPTHTFGQYFMILYALIGIPVNGILYAYLGEFFGETFVKAFNRYKMYKMSHDQNYVPKSWGLVGQITLYLVPAAVLLIILPSCLFTYFEGWPYSVSVYYSFVTLSTIGFGDFIPTFQPHQEREFGISFKFYQAFVIIWFVFGLSYLLMIIGFIASGMQSKKLAKLEQHLTENLKFTHNKIWSGMTKDVSALRRILNEVHMMKLKPVYIEPGHGAIEALPRRSESCPDLMYARSSSMPMPKKRAVSVHYDSRSRHSDTELNKIDKQKTFFDPSKETFNTNSMLARVLQSLGHVGADNKTSSRNVGLGLFGLGSELVTCQSFASGFSTKTTEIEFATPPTKLRGRAVSEFRPKTIPSDMMNWNGLSTMEMKKSCSEDNNVFSDTSVILNIDNESKLMNQNNKKLSCPSKRNSLQVDYGDSKFQNDLQNYLDYSSSRRESKISLSKQIRRGSQLPTIESSPEDLLESTTLGDFLRAIAIAETHNALLSDIESTGLPETETKDRRSSLYPTHVSMPNNNLSKRRQSVHPDMEKYLLRYDHPFGLRETNFERKLSTRLSTKTPPKQSSFRRRFSIKSNQGIKLFKDLINKESQSCLASGRRASHASGMNPARNITWKHTEAEKDLETQQGSLPELDDDTKPQ